MTTRKIYSVESHEQALEIWRDIGTRNANVLHLDFHCDLRGLLINRKTQRAFRIRDRFEKLNEGNFLTHAFLEGVVSGIRWVHDEPGGRKNDLKTVKYESDVSAIVHRIKNALQRNPGQPIDYEAITNADWTGIKPDEILDIDWDYFACLEYSVDSIQRRIDGFLSRPFEFIPAQTIVCHSPEYCHPTKSLFETFVDELAERFNATVVQVPLPIQPRSTSGLKAILGPVYQPARHLYQTACLALRKRGIF